MDTWGFGVQGIIYCQCSKLPMIPVARGKYLGTWLTDSCDEVA